MFIVGSRAHVENRIAGLACPRVHQLRYVNTSVVVVNSRYLFELIPQVDGARVRVGELFQIDLQASSERLGADKVAQHADDGRALAVGNRVEYLVEVGGRAHAHLDRMRALQTVQLERSEQVLVGVEVPYAPLGQHVLHAQILNPGGEAFVQPQICPPFLPTT